MKHLKKFNEEINPFHMDDEEKQAYQEGGGDREWQDKFSIRERDDVVDMYVKQSMAGPTYQKNLVITTKSGETYNIPLSGGKA